MNGETITADNGVYSFKMPAVNVTVEADFDEKTDISTAKLTANPLVFAYDGEYQWRDDDYFL